MKIKLILIPNSNKSLRDTVCSIIDKKSNAGLMSLGIKLGYNAVTLLGNGATNFTLQNIIFPLFKTKVSAFVTEDEYCEIYKKTKVKLIGDTGILTLDLDGIDYWEIMKRNLDVILDAVKTIYPDNVMWDIVDILQDDKDVIAETVLNSLSAEKKEKIVKLLITEFQTNICAAVTDTLNEEGIELAAKSLSVY